LKAVNVMHHFIILFTFHVLFYFDIIYHLYYNLKLYRLSFKKLFFLDDPYHFRIEIIPSSLLIFPYSILSLLFRFFYDDYGVNFRSTLISNMFYSIFMFTIFFTQFFGVVTMTVYKYLKRKLNKKVNEENLTENIYQCLNNQELYLIFLKFSREEWSHENILIWNDIQDFKNSYEIDEKIRISKYIYKTYLGKILCIIKR
jgi:hypothetical protein